MSMRRSTELSREKTPSRTPAVDKESRLSGGNGGGNWLAFDGRVSGLRAKYGVFGGGGVVELDGIEQ